MSELSRRTMLKGVAAGITVVGWSGLDRAWVPAGASEPPGMAGLPPLDGTVDTTAGGRAAFAGDFGRLVTATPTAVLHPGSVDDIVAMVRFARRHHLTIAMNGQSGTDGEFESHSNFGQALAEGGIEIDARGLATIHAIDGDVADVDAGVTWSDLTDQAAARGLTPPSLTDFLHLSVGGVLSVGGIGGTMQRQGAVVDNVVELQVVTGEGELETCSARRNPVLFNAVLAGAGQVAIIVRAKLRLIPVQSSALVFNLFYDDLATYIADSLTVMRDGRFTYQEGQIVRRPDDSGWRYMLEAAVYFTPPASPDQDALLAGLSDNRSELVVTTPTYLEWVHRVDPIVPILKGAGFWAQPHPWVSLFVPASRTQEFITHVVDALTPADLGAGLATFFPFRTASLHRPLFVVPRPEREAFQLTLLRFPFPGTPDVSGLLAQNRDFFDTAVALGGKRYIIGAVPDMSPGDWRRHYGRVFPFFRLLKRIEDPDRVLTPGQHIFG